MEKIEKLYVSKKDGDCYYFRKLGAHTDGCLCDVNDRYIRLVIEGKEEINVGDFIIAEKRFKDEEENKYDLYCHKVEPTEQDIENLRVDQEFLLEVAKNAGLFFKEMLDYGKEKILEEGQTEKDIVYGDKKINNLVQRLVDSVTTYGVYSIGGTGLWWFYNQLSKNNLFRSFVDYRKVLGITIRDLDFGERPTCVPKEYSDRLYLYISTTIYDKYNPAVFKLEYGDNSFCIKKYSDKVEVTPYVAGDFKEEMERLNKYQK